MSAKKEYVKLWLSYGTYFESYTPEQIGNLVLAMLAYKDSGREPDFQGPERFIWPAVRRDMDEARDAQEAAAALSRENGRLGGRPRKTQSAGPADAPAQENPGPAAGTQDNPSGFSETRETLWTKDNGQGHCHGQGQGRPGEGEGPPPRRYKRKKQALVCSAAPPEEVRENMGRMERYLSQLRAGDPGSPAGA